MRTYLKLLGTLILALALGTAGAVWGSPIDPGFDLFHTPDGTVSLTISTVGTVAFKSKGIGGSDTDTIVERKTGLAAGATGVIPAEIVALSLQSVSPVMIGSSFFDVFVTINKLGFPDILQPDPLSPSVGTLTITMHDDSTTPGEGTFTSFFDVFVDIVFKDTVTGDITSTPALPDTLTSTGPTRWVHTSAPSFGAWPTGGFSVPGGVSHTGPHPQTVRPQNPPPPVPEPGTLSLIASGLAVMALLARRRRAAGG